MEPGPLRTFVAMMRLAGFRPHVNKEGTAIMGPRGTIEAIPGTGTLQVRRVQLDLSNQERSEYPGEVVQNFRPEDLPAGCAALINIGLAEFNDPKFPPDSMKSVFRAGRTPPWEPRF